jgi:AbrB family looped-hinge helix DNA binding protein
MPAAKLTKSGKLTLPKVIRQLLQLQEGDRVDFVVRSDGTIQIRACGVDVRDLKGHLRKPGQRPRSLEEMDAGYVAQLRRSTNVFGSSWRPSGA